VHVAEPHAGPRSARTPPPAQRTVARTRNTSAMATAALELPVSLAAPTSIRSISHKSRSWGRARGKAD